MMNMESNSDIIFLKNETQILLKDLIIMNINNLKNAIRTLYQNSKKIV